MEQQVHVTMHGSKPSDPSGRAEAGSHAFVPKPDKNIGETLSDVLLFLRESEPGRLVMQGAEKSKEYIKKNPAQAMLISLGAGALMGLLIKRKR
ncbi:MAG: hypothetical protein WCG61_04865 [Chlorobium sp.]